MRIFILLLILLLLAAGSILRAHAAESRPKAVPAPEWDALFDRSDGWIGGDAIDSTPLSGQEILWLFADTFVGQVRDRRRQQGVKMINNTLARHPRRAAGEPPSPHSIDFLWRTDENGPAAWIVPDPKLRSAGTDSSEQWYWLADAIVAPGLAGRDRLLVFLWRLAPTDSKVFAFRNAGTALAVIDHPGTEWHTWQPQQFDDAHARVATDGRQGLVDVVWGSEIILDNAVVGLSRFTLIVLGIPKTASPASRPGGWRTCGTKWEFCESVRRTSPGMVPGGSQTADC